jgi:hypothetical protein
VNRKTAPRSHGVSFWLAAAVVLLSAGTAEADVSSWLSLDMGASQFRSVGFEREVVPSLRLSTGMGTDPSHDWILGGVARSETLFGSGTDLSLSLRLTDHGFANGQWGFAVDAGPLARWWGENVYGATTALTVGGPWGLEAGLQATLGESSIRTYGCFFGIDLARLTIYRHSGEDYWENTFPAYRPTDEAQRRDAP